VLVVFFFIRSFFSGVEAEQGSNLRRKNKAATTTHNNRNSLRIMIELSRDKDRVLIKKELSITP
jgi:hypothetical protein